MIKQEKIKVGDMVRVSQIIRSSEETPDSEPVEGIVTCVESRETLFSEKYCVTETETCIHVLHDGAIKYFYLEEDLIEVISQAKGERK